MNIPITPPITEKSKGIDKYDPCRVRKIIQDQKGHGNITKGGTDSFRNSLQGWLQPFILFYKDV